MEREPYLKVQAQLLAIGQQLKALDVASFIGAIDDALPSTPDQSTIDAVLNIKRLAQAAVLFQDAYNTLAFTHRKAPMGVGPEHFSDKPTSGAQLRLKLSALDFTPFFHVSPADVAAIKQHVPAPEPAVFEPGAFKP